MKKIFFLLLLCFMTMFGKEQKKPMKILMVVSTFPKIHEICMLNQMTGLIDRGHDVHIFAFHRGNDTEIQPDVITYDLLNKTIFEKLPNSLDEYDIVVFQLGHKLFDIKERYNFNGKVAVCLRGYDITVFVKKNSHAYDAYFDSCDLFMPVCEAFKKILSSIGCPPHKIVIQHSAIDCSRFKFTQRDLPQNGVINIVSAGRFVEKKGFEYALHAIAQLVKKYSNIHYTLIGDGSLKKEYEKLIKKLKISDKVTLHSWCAHDEYISLLDQAHIFILPSVTAKNNDQEGIPNVLKEAMAMGLLVIATDHSGNGELIEHGKSGFLVPERDSNALVQTVDYLLQNPKKWSSIQATAAQKVYENFDMEKENDKLEAILYQLLKQ